METLAALEQEVATLMASEELDFSKGKGSNELFIIFLYMYAQRKAKDSSKGYLALIFELLKQAQK